MLASTEKWALILSPVSLCLRMSDMLQSWGTLIFMGYASKFKTNFVKIMSKVSKQDCIHNKPIPQCTNMRVCIHHQ